MRPPPPASAGNQAGSVIVLVLALVTLAGFFLTLFIERSTTELLVESRAREAGRLRGEAHSALEASLAVLANFQVIDGGLRSPAQGWGDPLAGLELPTRAGTTVAVQVEDESGRLSLPRLGAPELAALGQRLGLKAAEATQLADALLAWTRREHTSTRLETDPRNYEHEDPPHRAPGRPLASFEELAAVAVARELFYTPAGLPTKLLRDFADSVSLHDFPAVNLNSARPAVLALAGLDEAQVKKIIAYNSGEISRSPGTPLYFRSLAEAQALLGATVPLAGFDTLARCLRVRVTVRDGATSFHLTAVLAPVAGAPAQSGETPAGLTAGAADLRYPFKLLALAENLELVPTPTL